MSRVSMLLTRAQYVLMKAREAYEEYDFLDISEGTQLAIEASQETKAIPRFVAVRPEVPEQTMRVPSVLNEQPPALVSHYDYQVYVNPDEREPIWETMVRDYPDEALVVLDRLNRRFTNGYPTNRIRYS